MSSTWDGDPPPKAARTPLATWAWVYLVWLVRHRDTRQWIRDLADGTSGSDLYRWVRELGRAQRDDDREGPVT